MGLLPTDLRNDTSGRCDNASVNVNTAWSVLPVAGEYGGQDIRYFWQYLKQVQNVSNLNSGNYSDKSYICFLFKDAKLFAISLRFINDSQYPSYNAFVDKIVTTYGVRTQQLGNTNRFRIDTSKVLFHGTSDSYGTFINVIRSGSPLADGEHF